MTAGFGSQCPGIWGPLTAGKNIRPVDLRECIKSPCFKNSETNCDHLESRIEMEA